ncbi:hypothetical protein CEUSTIGMA_g12274.t1 [Chlamydomonas eustigma]|uniref:rRNA adenine N(6)-methyltransferase n=1 Tax=Chlamydomonas eustigma TaxID=1157962 RepID=A0A250XPC6_9CHLO|nr:hypothetical protein CEUSTIGMA_g12274.t1 [Chlamydomonas eustigma]|eukprot:GAX84853.1 hypothetical protein CEUSTIGMA_g12274.t1 [Chlamydomonas eustigma]
MHKKNFRVSNGVKNIFVSRASRLRIRLLALQPQESTAPSDEKKIEIPPMGWLWQAGKSPSASATVANLRENRIKPKKSLGQNFLTDDNILKDIVSASGVQPGDLVLEIGPGTGNLTKHLLERGALVTAVEKDDTLYERLIEEYKDNPSLKIVKGDVLRSNVDQIIRDMIQQHRGCSSAHSSAHTQSDVELHAEANSASTSNSIAEDGSSDVAFLTDAAALRLTSNGSHSGSIPPAPSDETTISNSSDTGSEEAAELSHLKSSQQDKVRVVANLPYNITKEFLKLMLPKGHLVSELNIMIQEEVAWRLVNKTPGRPDYRAMNLRVQFYSKPKYRFLIPKERYFPAPGVDGALVTFRLLPPLARPSVPSERGFIALVGKAFLERRKMMRNSVQPLYTSQQMESALVHCGLRPDSRAQDLSLADFVGVHRALGEAVAKELLVDYETAD